DRVVDRVAGLAIPDDRRFPLIGDADRGNIPRAKVAAAEGFGRDRNLRCPDFAGVVLDPARLRKDLLKLLLADRDNGPVVIEHDGAGAGGPLVQRGTVWCAYS